MGLATALALLLVVEGVIWIAALATGNDYRLDLTPEVPFDNVVCGKGKAMYLCPDNGDRYERVRPEHFSLVPERPRVIILGESFVNGLGVQMSHAMPARLGAHLGKRVEVLNFGRCGTYAGALRPSLTAALRLQPTVVVLAIGNNEHTMTTFFVGYASSNPHAFRVITSLLSPFQIPGVINRAMGSPVRLREEATLPPNANMSELEKRIYAARRRPPDLALFQQTLAWPGVTLALEEEHRLKEQIFAMHLKQMVREIRAAGSLPVLATPPQRLTDPPTLSGCHPTEEGVCLKVRQILGLVHPGDNKKTRKELAQIMALDPEVAMAHYMLADMDRKEKKRAAAIERMIRSADLDLVPEGTPALRDIIRKLAAEEDVPLADLDTLAVTHFDHPLRVFRDRVHLNEHGCDEAAKMLKKVVAPLLKEALAPPDMGVIKRDATSW